MKDNDEKMAARIKMILRQFEGTVKKDDGELIPEVAIKGSGGHVYCYHPTKKTFVRICRGTKAFVITGDENSEKVLIYTFDGKMVEIEREELIETGFD